MVKGQCRRLAEKVPAYFRGIVARACRQSVVGRSCQKYYAHDPAARITARIAKGLQLFESAQAQPRFFLDFAPDGFFQGLVHFDEAARQGPSAGERRVLAADEQNPIRLRPRHQRHIHRHRGPRIVVSVLLGHVKLLGRSSPAIVRWMKADASKGNFMFDLLLTGGRIVDGSGLPWYEGDLGITGERVAAMGRLNQAESRQRLDVTGKTVAPGFIDAHVHGDLALLADPYHEPAIRQGVTTYILGQDGVAMAPASPATLDYMRRYTAGFSGTFATDKKWSSLDEYLACFDRQCALNVACLVPNGNLRMEAFGLETRPPTPDELRHMGRLLREAMDQGAVGLSSGLDYIPSRYAETEEFIALCREMADHGGVYVTHMRRYDPEGVLDSMDEVFRIGREAGVAVHISHFNSRADLVVPKLDEGRAAGIDVTFDLYCYLAGSSILAMNALPPWAQVGGIDATLARLADASVRTQLKSWFAAPRVPLDTIRLSFIAAPEYRQFEGKTLAESVHSAGKEMGDFVCDVLVASRMAVGCVVPHRGRGPEDVVGLMRHPAMMAGSDGIYTGSFPHPRGCGCFARFLGHYVREERAWSLEQAVQKLSAHAARRFGLRDRGLLRPGMAADVVVFDAAAITDVATYDDGRQLAQGVEHVIVNGQLVMHQGRRTRALPGRALRRG
jgi:N-acyl-D-amino-acid deacylase